MKQKIANRISNLLYRYLGIICLLLIMFDLFGTIRSSLVIMQESVDEGIVPVQNEIEYTFESTIMLGKALTNSSSFFFDDSKPMRKRSEELQAVSKSYNLFLIGITDVDGKIISSFDDTPGSIGYRDYFKKVVSTGEMAVTDIIKAGADGVTENFTVCIPYFSESGEVIGTIILAIYFDGINKIINRKSINSSSHFSLLDSKNKIMANADSKYVNMPLSLANELSRSKGIGRSIQNIEKDIAEGKNGSFWSINKHGIEYVKYTPIKNTEWKLMLRANILDNLSTLFNMFLFKSLMYILIFGLLSLRKNKEIFYREKLFNIVSEHIDDVFFIYNRKEKRLDYISTNVERIFGITYEEVMVDPDKIYSLFDENVCKKVHSDITKGSTGHIFNYETIIKNYLDGSDNNYFVRIYFVTDDIGTERYITLISDTTKLKQQQQSLIDALTIAEHASKSKSQFLSSMSHEIRTPMNAIINMTAFAKENVDDKIMVTDCVTNVQNAANYLLSLINDILDMAKIESGQNVLSNSVFSMNELINEIVSIIGPQAKDKKINFEIKNNLSNYNLCGDKLKLSKILLNILSNAIKFTKNGGTIDFSIDQTSPENSKAIMNFKITDNGIGMDADFLKVIFEPFTQAKSENAAKHAGTGLGMAICKNLVTAMDGNISASSTKGVGSEFNVSIPFEIADNKDNKECSIAENISYDFTDKRILLVEDNEINIRIAVMILKKTNISIEIARNGKDAFEMFHTNPANYYDAVLMDIQMPVMDGIESAKLIRSSKKDDNLTIPIIALSANAFQDDITKSIACGMNEHLTKPLDSQRLFFTLSRYICK